MSEIDLPQAPGFFISRWREKGPVDIETLTQWRDEMNWKTWLPLAEAAMYLDAAELLEILETALTPAETATLALVRRRMLGDTRLQQSIEEALDIARHPDTRDLALEGRLRMELGLATAFVKVASLTGNFNTTSLGVKTFMLTRCSLRTVSDNGFVPTSATLVVVSSLGSVSVS